MPYYCRNTGCSRPRFMDSPRNLVGFRYICSSCNLPMEWEEHLGLAAAETQHQPDCPLRQAAAARDACTCARSSLGASGVREKVEGAFNFNSFSMKGFLNLVHANLTGQMPGVPHLPPELWRHIHSFLKPAILPEMAAGGGHTVLLTEEGRVYTFGSGEGGQLGNGRNRDFNTPQLV